MSEIRSLVKGKVRSQVRSYRSRAIRYSIYLNRMDWQPLFWSAGRSQHGTFPDRVSSPHYWLLRSRRTGDCRCWAEWDESAARRTGTGVWPMCGLRERGTTRVQVCRLYERGTGGDPWPRPDHRGEPIRLTPAVPSYLSLVPYPGISGPLVTYPATWLRVATGDGVGTFCRRVLTQGPVGGMSGKLPVADGPCLVLLCLYASFILAQIGVRSAGSNVEPTWWGPISSDQCGGCCWNTHLRTVLKISPIRPASWTGVSATSQMVRRMHVLPSMPNLRLQNML